jgi:hypothetical protein
VLVHLARGRILHINVVIERFARLRNLLDQVL